MRPLKLVVLLILFATNAWAAMSDSAAMAKAQALWGAKGLILQCRFPTDTYWTKQVGYFDGMKIVILGSAPNTWDAAFASVQATGNFPVCGAAPAVTPTANVTIQPFSQELLDGLPFDFTVFRDGATTQDLTVNYFLGGGLRPTIDYVPDVGGYLKVLALTIPAGSASLKLHFQAVAANSGSMPWCSPPPPQSVPCNPRPETMTIQLLPGSYILAANNSANATVFTKEERPDLVTALPPPAPNQVPIGETIRLQIPLRNK